MHEKLSILEQKLQKAKSIYKKTNSWADFEEVTLYELMILLAERDIKNGS